MCSFAGAPRTGLDITLPAKVISEIHGDRRMSMILVTRATHRSTNRLLGAHTWRGQRELLAVLPRFLPISSRLPAGRTVAPGDRRYRVECTTGRLPAVQEPAASHCPACPHTGRADQAQSEGSSEMAGAKQ